MAIFFRRSQSNWYTVLSKHFLVGLLIGAQLLVHAPHQRAYAENDDFNPANPDHDEIPQNAHLAQTEAFDLPEYSAAERDQLAREVSEAFTSDKHAELDIFSLLDQQEFPHKNPDSIGDNLTYVLTDKNGQEIGRRLAATFRQELRTYGATSVDDFNSPVYLRIEYQGQPLYKFERPITSLTQFGDYLVMRPADAKDAEGPRYNLQFIDFATYRYQIGRTRLPVFMLPVPSENGADPAIEISANELRVGATVKLKKGDMESYAFAQRLTADLMANLVDPTTHTEASRLVEEFSLIFDKAIEVAGQDKLAQLKQVSPHERGEGSLHDLLQQTLQAAAKIKPLPSQTVSENEFNALEQQRDAMFAWHDMNTVEGRTFEKSLRSIGEAQKTQQKMLARFRALWMRLSLPRPDSAPTLIKGLAMVGRGLIKGKPFSYDVKEGAAQFVHHPYVKYGAPVVAAAVLGQTYPELTDYAIQSLGMGKAVVDHVFNGAVLGWESLKSGFAFTDLSALKKAYIDNGNLGRLSVGVPVAVSALFMTIGIPHLIVNSVKLGKDLYGKLETFKHLKQGPRGWANWWINLGNRFIARQEHVQAEYLQNLSDAEHKAQGKTDSATFTAEQDTLANSIVAERDKQERSWIGDAVTSIKDWHFFKTMSRWKSTRLFTSLSHFCFSAASFTMSGIFYVKTWNAWFLQRTILWHPAVMATFLYYPNFYKTIMSHDNTITSPTELNGGLRRFDQAAYVTLRKMMGDGLVDKMLAFENAILPIEIAIQKECLRKAFTAALQHAQSQDDIRQMVARGEFKHISEQAVAALTNEQQIFVRTYYTLLYEKAMRQFLEEKLEKVNVISSARGAKDAYVEAYNNVEIPLPTLDEAEAKELVGNLATNAVYTEATRQVAEARSEGVLSYLSNMASNMVSKEAHLQRVETKLNPESNRQIARLQSVNRQLNNPQAMARAVRATMVSFIVDKPIELTLLFLMLAGVTEGANRPLYDEMFGPNSFFYLGRMAIWNGFIASLVMGVFSDIWAKLQADEMHEGRFGEVPDGEDAKRSYASWFFKKMNSKGNSIWDGHKHNAKLIFANMKAAAVTLMLTNFLTLGRMDLDLYFTGYFLWYFTPHWAIGNKIEQGFELSTGYFAKDFPEDLRAHPRVQAYLMKHAHRARIKFNIFYKLFWENPTGIVLSVMQAAKTTELGPRAFARFLFGGSTPTELVAGALDQAKASSWTSAVPGLDRALGACKSFFTNNYTDWKDLP